MTFADKEGNFIVVDKGPYGNWTFYRKQDMKKKGARVKGRSTPLWFDTQGEAEEALAEYAKDRGWKQTSSR